MRMLSFRLSLFLFSVIIIISLRSVRIRQVHGGFRSSSLDSSNWSHSRTRRMQMSPAPPLSFAKRREKTDHVQSTGRSEHWLAFSEEAELNQLIYILILCQSCLLARTGNLFHASQTTLSNLLVRKRPPSVEVVRGKSSNGKTLRTTVACILNGFSNTIFTQSSLTVNFCANNLQSLGWCLAKLLLPGRCKGSSWAILIPHTCRHHLLSTVIK